MSHDDIENKLKEMMLLFKKDYESQTITDKKRQVKKACMAKKR